MVQQLSDYSDYEMPSGNEKITICPHEQVVFSIFGPIFTRFLLNLSDGVGICRIFDGPAIGPAGYDNKYYYIALNTH